MCIECPSHGTSSSGVSARGIVMTLVVAVTVVATYRILEVAWPFLLTVWAVAALWVWVPPARPLLRTLAASPVLLTLWWLRRRRATRTTTAVTPATGAAWSVTAYLKDRPPSVATVRGNYRSAAELEAETWGRLKLAADQTGQPLPEVERIVARKVLTR